MKRADLLATFVGRRCGRDEIDFFEIEGLSDFLGKAKVAQVDRIKGASEDAQSQAVTSLLTSSSGRRRRQ
jgi:hypothetical protein